LFRIALVIEHDRPTPIFWKSSPFAGPKPVHVFPHIFFRGCPLAVKATVLATFHFCRSGRARPATGFRPAALCFSRIETGACPASALMPAPACKRSIGLPDSAPTRAEAPKAEPSNPCACGPSRAGTDVLRGAGLRSSGLRHRCVFCAATAGTPANRIRGKITNPGAVSCAISFPPFKTSLKCWRPEQDQNG